MSGHSKYFSPSSLHRRITCNLSAFLEAGMPEESSAAADEGTMLHGIMQLDNDSKPYDMPTDPGQRDAILITIEHTKQVMAMAPSAHVMVEHQVGLIHLGHEDVHGTADLIVDEFFGTLIVLDYKFGQMRVSPNGPQLRTYAIGAAGPVIHSYEKIILAISQPRVSDQLQIVELTPEELMAWWKAVLEPTVLAIKAGNMRANPTDEGCQYCRGKRLCAAYTHNALVTAQQDFGGEPVAGHASSINDGLVAEYYPKLPLLESWIDSVKKHAFTMAERGDLPGYKIVAGRSNRRWTDEAAAQATIEAAGFEAFEKKLLSPAKAEKLDKGLKAAIKGLAESAPGNPTIAPLTDKRQAITTARQDFQAISA